MNNAKTPTFSGLRSFLATSLGKLAHYCLSRLGRGSTYPGRLALKVDPNLLKTLAKDYQIIVVTGTNGKTLTTALTVGILTEAYGQVLTNPSGANMISGITTAFLGAKKAKDAKKVAVLEIDEASLAKITRYLTPDLFVFTNIFRDQMDRYGEIYTTYQMILDGVANAPQATILANGDSPIFQTTHLPNPIHYYGFDTAKGEWQQAHYNTEGILCPNCHQILQYRLNTYANLGDYACPNGDFKRPELDYRLSQLSDLTNRSSRFVIDGQEYSIRVGGLYNIYNALAAVSVAEYLKIDPSVISAGFNKSRAVFGRQETFKIGQKNCTLVLIKNPVGATQALQMMALTQDDFSLAVLLNADYADGIDTSWIWDADFEAIQNMPIRQVVAGGVRHSEMARRLRVTGYPAHKIQEANDLEAVLTFIQAQESDQVYILATYTAMLQFREQLANLGAVRKEMA